MEPLEKSPDAFRTISEAADELDLPQHVLRFWETRFSQIKPLKRGGGRRYYRPDDVQLLRGIRYLLYDEGFTIKGVQKILKENGYDILDIRDHGLRGEKDERIYEFAQNNKAIILTGDRGFGNTQRFPLGKHNGIVVTHFPQRNVNIND